MFYLIQDNIRLPSDDEFFIEIRGYLEKLLVCRNIPKLSKGFTKQQKES